MNDDMELVSDYAACQSEPAFVTIVSRYIHLVYSAALRQVRDPHLAEEVTQAVFIILARKAGSLGPKTILPSWLHRTACFAARDALRTELRRRQREQEAFMQASSGEPSSPTDEVWSQIAPMLDAAMAGLSKKDHQAVVLRFLENKDLNEVGRALGVNEDAARMRLNRALERLRKFFIKHGIVSTTAALGAAISANSIQAAPAALAAAATAAAIGKGAATGSSTLVLVKSTLKLIAWAKAQTAVVLGTTVLLAAGTTTVAVKELNRGEAYSWQVPYVTETNGFAILSNTPPQVKIVPTRFPQGGGRMGAIITTPTAVEIKMLGIAVSPQMLVMTAYPEIRFSRIAYRTALPNRKYDFIVNLPHGSVEAFRKELRKTVGLTGRPEIMETNVLLMKLATPTAEAFKAAGSLRQRLHMTNWWDHGTNFTSNEGYTSVRFEQPLSTLEIALENVFKLPVVNGTGLTNRYDFSFTWPFNNDPRILREALLKQLGLELVPSRERIEMLVVERSAK